MRRLSGRRAGLGRGDRGGEKGAAHCGTGSGAFGIKGLAARIYFAFTLASPPAPAVAPATPSAAPMARIIAGRKGAGERLAGHAGPVGQCARHEPRKSRPGPHNRLQEIALGPDPWICQAPCSWAVSDEGAYRSVLRFPWRVFGPRPDVLRRFSFQSSRRQGMSKPPCLRACAFRQSDPAEVPPARCVRVQWRFLTFILWSEKWAKGTALPMIRKGGRICRTLLQIGVWSCTAPT